MTYQSSSKGVKFTKLSASAILANNKVYSEMQLGRNVVVISCPTCESDKGQLFVYDLANLDLITTKTGG